MEPKKSRLVTTPAAHTAGHVTSRGTLARKLASIKRTGMIEVDVVHVTKANMISQLASMLKSVPPTLNSRH